MKFGYLIEHFDIGWESHFVFFDVDKATEFLEDLIFDNEFSPTQLGIQKAYPDWRVVQVQVEPKKTDIQLQVPVCVYYFNHGTRRYERTQK